MCAFDAARNPPLSKYQVDISSISLSLLIVALHYVGCYFSSQLLNITTSVPISVQFSFIYM